MAAVQAVAMLAFGLSFEDSCSHTGHGGDIAGAVEAVLDMRSHGALVFPSIDPTKPSDRGGPTAWQHRMRCFDSNSARIPVSPASCSRRMIRLCGRNRES